MSASNRDIQQSPIYPLRYVDVQPDTIIAFDFTRDTKSPIILALNGIFFSRNKFLYTHFEYASESFVPNGISNIENNVFAISGTEGIASIVYKYTINPIKIDHEVLIYRSIPDSYIIATVSNDTNVYSIYSNSLFLTRYNLVTNTILDIPLVNLYFKIAIVNDVIFGINSTQDEIFRIEFVANVAVETSILPIANEGFFDLDANSDVLLVASGRSKLHKLFNPLTTSTWDTALDVTNISSISLSADNNFNLVFSTDDSIYYTNDTISATQLTFQKPFGNITKVKVVSSLYVTHILTDVGGIGYKFLSDNYVNTGLKSFVQIENPSNTLQNGFVGITGHGILAFLPHKRGYIDSAYDQNPIDNNPNESFTKYQSLVYNPNSKLLLLASDSGLIGVTGTWITNKFIEAPASPTAEFGGGFCWASDFIIWGGIDGEIIYSDDNFQTSLTANPYPIGTQIAGIRESLDPYIFVITNHATNFSTLDEIDLINDIKVEQYVSDSILKKFTCLVDWEWGCVVGTSLGTLIVLNRNIPIFESAKLPYSDSIKAVTIDRTRQLLYVVTDKKILYKSLHKLNEPLDESWEITPLYLNAYDFHDIIVDRHGEEYYISIPFLDLIWEFIPSTKFSGQELQALGSTSSSGGIISINGDTSAHQILNSQNLLMASGQSIEDAVNASGGTVALNVLAKGDATGNLVDSRIEDTNNFVEINAPTRIGLGDLRIEDGSLILGDAAHNTTLRSSTTSGNQNNIIMDFRVPLIPIDDVAHVAIVRDSLSGQNIMFAISAAPKLPSLINPINEAVIYWKGHKDWNPTRDLLLSDSRVFENTLTNVDFQGVAEIIKCTGEMTSGVAIQNIVLNPNSIDTHIISYAIDTTVTFSEPMLEGSTLTIGILKDTPLNVSVGFANTILWETGSDDIYNEEGSLETVVISMINGTIYGIRAIQGSEQGTGAAARPSNFRYRACAQYLNTFGQDITSHNIVNIRDNIVENLTCLNVAEIVKHTVESNIATIAAGVLTLNIMLGDSSVTEVVHSENITTFNINVVMPANSMFSKKLILRSGNSTQLTIPLPTGSITPYGASSITKINTTDLIVLNMIYLGTDIYIFQEWVAA